MLLSFKQMIWVLDLKGELFISRRKLLACLTEFCILIH